MLHLYFEVFVMADMPFMPLYVADYLADTTHLTTEAHGAYMLILMVMWKERGRIPNDDLILARIARMTPTKWQKMKPSLMVFFRVDGETISHKRLEKEFQKAKNLGEIRSEIGKRGADAKRLKSLNTEKAIGSALLKQKPSKQQPSQTPDSIKERNTEPLVLSKEKRGTRLPPDFVPDVTGWNLAQELGYNTQMAQGEFDNFLDYWRSVPGAKGLKLDWQATFRTWIRRASKDLRGKNVRHNSTKPARKSTHELIAENNDFFGRKGDEGAGGD
jgi:uncharacterized protein YdaU (DUF1376 family)